MFESPEKFLVCPRDQQDLSREDNYLVCAAGHRYPVVNEIPVMLIKDVRQTAWWAESSMKTAEGLAAVGKRMAEPESDAGSAVDPYVQKMVAATSGFLYQPLVGNLKEYPIPELRLPDGHGKTLLDVGCNWGRWCVAAARKRYRVVGIDPSLEAALAARRVTNSLGLSAAFVVGDARHLPFLRETFDTVFSYSVIQHFSKDDARSALKSIASVLKRGGLCLIQMPNKFGVRSFYHLAKRKFAVGQEFDVRYWTVPELRKTFASIIGPTELSVDGYFGLGIQRSDIGMLPWKYRMVVRASEALRAASRRMKWLRYFADSIYVKSTTIRGSEWPQPSQHDV